MRGWGVTIWMAVLLCREGLTAREVSGWTPPRKPCREERGRWGVPSKRESLQSDVPLPGGAPPGRSALFCLRWYAWYSWFRVIVGESA